MSDRFARLSRRILDELDKVDYAIHRAQRGWHDFQASGNDLFLDSISLSLQSAYNGVEVIFELIARDVDLLNPQGGSWHQQLLMQMTDEVSGVRPAVISVKSGQALNEFRGFRHVTRHLYPFELDSDRIAAIMTLVDPTFSLLRAELTAFANFLTVAAPDPEQNL